MMFKEPDIDLETQTAELLSYIGQTLQNTEDFVSHKAPLVAQDILTWGILSNSIYAFNCFIIIFAFLAILYVWKRIIKAIYKRYNNEAAYEDYNNIWKIGAIIISFICVMISLVALNFIMHALKPILTPRLYIIDYIQTLS